MFAVGVDEMDWDDLNESHYNWPSVNNTFQYRQQVKAAVLKLIDECKDQVGDWENDLWVIVMGIEH